MVVLIMGRGDNHNHTYNPVYGHAKQSIESIVWGGNVPHVHLGTKHTHTLHLPDATVTHRHNTLITQSLSHNDDNHRTGDENITDNISH